MLIYLTVFGILASTAAAKGAYLVWSGGGDARFLSATSDYLYNGTAVGLYVQPLTKLTAGSRSSTHTLVQGRGRGTPPGRRTCRSAWSSSTRASA